MHVVAAVEHAGRVQVNAGVEHAAHVQVNAAVEHAAHVHVIAAVLLLASTAAAFTPTCTCSHPAFMFKPALKIVINADD